MELVVLTQILEIIKRQRVNTLILNMLIWLYMLMLHYGNKDSLKQQQENLLSISKFQKDWKNFGGCIFPLKKKKKKLLYIAKGTEGPGVKQPREISWMTAKSEKRPFTKNLLHYRCPWSGQVLLNRKNHSILRKTKAIFEKGAKITDKGWLQSEDS